MSFTAHDEQPLLSTSPERDTGPATGEESKDEGQESMYSAMLSRWLSETGTLEPWNSELVWAKVCDGNQKRI
jgi:hypothetical protein